MEYIGKGIYSIPDVHRLTGMPSQSISRWVRGYEYKHQGKKKKSPKLWIPDYKPVNNKIGLSFKDLIEINLVYAFRKTGLSLRIIRNAMTHAQDIFGIDHPFCTMQFLTDGRNIFREVHNETGEPTLEELFKRQIVFKEIISPFLKQLEFDNDILLRWWPLTKNKRVVLDPNRNFGQPIVNKEGVLTEVLANAYKANESIEVVSSWYNVSKPAIKDAIEYEKNLAKAA